MCFVIFGHVWTYLDQEAGNFDVQVPEAQCFNFFEEGSGIAHCIDQSGEPFHEAHSLSFSVSRFFNTQITHK
jgi:hypothetical protein